MLPFQSLERQVVERKKSKEKRFTASDDDNLQPKGQMLESSSAEKHLTTLFAVEDLLWLFKACCKLGWFYELQTSSIIS